MILNRPSGGARAQHADDAVGNRRTRALYTLSEAANRMGLAPRVEVLLATYNGERFLREQIESIFAQSYQNLAVLARDDGSTDGTLDILKQYARSSPQRFKLLEASSVNAGFLNNFWHLIKASTAPYVCFCDQDDIWLPAKVGKTQALLGELEQQWGSNLPLLAFTDLRVVDEDLNTIHPSFWECMNIEPERIHDFPRLLPCTVVTGCTMMVNRRLVELASAMPREVSVHDRWVGLLAAAMGRTAFLREQTVLYRQHGKNAIGVGNRADPRTFLQRIRGLRASAAIQIKVWRGWQADAEALLRIHGEELQPDIRKAIDAFRRCESSDSRWVRLGIFLAHAFFPPGLSSKLVIPLYLWFGSRRWSKGMERV